MVDIVKYRTNTGVTGSISETGTTVVLPAGVSYVDFTVDLTPPSDSSLYRAWYFEQPYFQEYALSNKYSYRISVSALSNPFSETTFEVFTGIGRRLDFILNGQFISVSKLLSFNLQFTEEVPVDSADSDIIVIEEVPIATTIEIDNVISKSLVSDSASISYLRDVQEADIDTLNSTNINAQDIQTNSLNSPVITSQNISTSELSANQVSTNLVEIGNYSYTPDLGIEYKDSPNDLDKRITYDPEEKLWDVLPGIKGLEKETFLYGVKFLATGAGQSDEASLYLNEEYLYPNGVEHGTGLRLTILSVDGEYITSSVYDTLFDPSASSDLMLKIFSMEAGQIGIITSQGGFESNITETLKTVLKTVGLLKLSEISAQPFQIKYAGIFQKLNGSSTRAVENTTTNSETGSVPYIKGIIKDGTFHSLGPSYIGSLRGVDNSIQAYINRSNDLVVNNNLLADGANIKNNLFLEPGIENGIQWDFSEEDLLFEPNSRIYYDLDSQALNITSFDQDDSSYQKIRIASEKIELSSELIKVDADNFSVEEIGDVNVFGTLNVSTAGIKFPDDAFGGGGDTAKIFLTTGGGENTQLTLQMTNDALDEIHLRVPNDNGVKINDNIVWHQGNLSTTDNLPEGVTNLYYTSARFDSDFSTKTTTDLTEGDNLYYTQDRFDTAFSNKTTTDLTEGVNLYYTKARVDSDVNQAISEIPSISSTDSLPEGLNNLYYTQDRFDTAFSNKTTTDLTEGDNLYYTDSRSRNAISVTNNAYQSFVNISYDNVTGVIDLSGARGFISDYDQPTDRSNSIAISSLQSMYFFLDENDNESDNYFGFYNNIEPTTGTVNKDNAIFSIEETGVVNLTGKLNVTTDGLEFPSDAFGGSGDTAKLFLTANSGEDTQLTLQVNNDPSDEIHFRTPSDNGVKINDNIVWHQGTIIPGFEGNTLFAKESNGSIYEPDEILKVANFLKDSNDFNFKFYEGKIPDQITIFNTWYRFSHNTSGNYPANASETTASQWVYDSATGNIIGLNNTGTYVGFVSSRKYDQYTHGTTFSSTQTDDDILSLLIAFTTEGDSAGDPSYREHTLSAIRNIGTIGGTVKWGIYYNYLQSDAKLISDGSSTAPSPGGGWSSAGQTRVLVDRSKDIIKSKTSQFGSAVIDDNTELTVDLNSDPDLYKFKGKQSYGYGAYSQGQATFSDISFSNNDIADITYSLFSNGSYTANSVSPNYYETVSDSANYSEIFGKGRFYHDKENFNTYYVSQNEEVFTIGKGKSSSYLCFGYDGSISNTSDVEMYTVNGASGGGWRIPFPMEITDISLQLDVTAVTGTESITLNILKNGTTVGEIDFDNINSTGRTGFHRRLVPVEYEAGDVILCTISQPSANITTADHSILVRILE